MNIQQRIIEQGMFRPVAKIGMYAVVGLGLAAVAPKVINASDEVLILLVAVKILYNGSNGKQNTRLRQLINVKVYNKPESWLGAHSV